MNLSYLPHMDNINRNYYNTGERNKGLPLQLCTKGILYFISNDIPLQIRSKDVKVLL